MTVAPLQGMPAAAKLSTDCPLMAMLESLEFMDDRGWVRMHTGCFLRQPVCQTFFTGVKLSPARRIPLRRRRDSGE
jgi:hypothetical protein